MSLTVVIGGFFGDEGKGKIISYLAINDKPTANPNFDASKARTK